MSDDTAIEKEIQEKGLTAARVTPERVDEVIQSKWFTQVPGTTLTFCVLTLRNGFTVTGESACASPENFNQELGEKIAYSNARDKIWALEGYLLKDRISTETIARMAHEVNRAYCAALGDHSQVQWEDAPEWQRISARSGVVMHKKNPDATPERSHEEWLKSKQADGWKWGPVKDPEKKEHPCCCSYAELSPEQRAKDYLFKGVVDAMLGR